MRHQSSQRGQQAWALQNDELIHGEILGVDNRLQMLTILTDGGTTLTLPREAVAFDVPAAHALIRRALTKLARASAALDRDGAVFVPLTVRGEKYDGVDI